MSESDFDNFRRIVLADRSLQEKLRDLTDRNDFVTALIELGRQRHCEFSSDDVERAMNLSRQSGAEEDTAPGVDELRNWIPIRVSRSGGLHRIDWCYAGTTRFTQPFFDDTIKQIFRRPFSLLFQHRTSFDVPGNLAESALKPTGFVFHMSRCGSTLVAQMLAALGKNIVISEAPPIDSALLIGKSSAELSGDEPASALKFIINALGQKREREERHYFIKFDSWNTLDLDLIGNTYPDVPWVFLYRDPVEVIVSHMRQRGSQMVPGNIDTLLPDVSVADAVKMPAEEYCARVLARICESAVEHAAEQRSLFVNYRELPGAVTGPILEHFGVAYSPEEIERMREAAAFNAKTPQLFFERDVEQKQAAATAATRAAAEKWVGPLYRRLETLRLEQTGVTL